MIQSSIASITPGQGRSVLTQRKKSGCNDKSTSLLKEVVVTESSELRNLKIPEQFFNKIQK